MLRDCRGVESVPVVLLLGLVLGALTLGLGASYLARIETLTSEQRARLDFEEFVLVAKQVSAGGLGSWQRVELELPEGAITLNGRLVQLMWKGEVRMAELLPLPVASNLSKIERGTYLLELQRGRGSCFLKISLEGSF